jgi:hypothetical protein
MQIVVCPGFGFGIIAVVGVKIAREAYPGPVGIWEDSAVPASRALKRPL